MAGEKVKEEEGEGKKKAKANRWWRSKEEDRCGKDEGRKEQKNERKRKKKERFSKFSNPKYTIIFL